MGTASTALNAAARRWLILVWRSLLQTFLRMMVALKLVNQSSSSEYQLDDKLGDVTID